jgi:hypothetical protein
MKKITTTLMICASLAIFSGCAVVESIGNSVSNSARAASSSGRFLKGYDTSTGLVMFENATQSPQECSTQLSNAARTPSFSSRCEQYSSAGELPWVLSANHATTGKLMSFRTRSDEICRFMVQLIKGSNCVYRPA